MLQLENYAPSLIERDGILFSEKESKISYPEGGNENCFQLEANSFWFNHRNNCIIEAVKRYSPKNLFFDIGGGNGFVAKGLEDNGISTVLIEPGIQGCLNAKKRGLENVICSTLENAALSKNKIPAIGLFDVVEHIENDINFLKSIYEILMDKGLIFITVPAYRILWSNEDIDAGHFRRYTVKNLEQKLVNIGFKIIYSTYIFSILPFPILLFRTIPSLLGFKAKTNDYTKHKSEHTTKNKIFEKAISKVWKIELNKIKEGRKSLFGGSCFIVAQKIY